MSSSIFKNCGIGGALLAIFIFHSFFGRELLPSAPSAQFDYGWDLVFVAAAVSALGSVVGVLIGSLLQRLLAHD